jgi:hypothetical protein
MGIYPQVMSNAQYLFHFLILLPFNVAVNHPFLDLLQVCLQRDSSMLKPYLDLFTALASAPLNGNTSRIFVHLSDSDQNWHQLLIILKHYVKVRSNKHKMVLWSTASDYRCSVVGARARTLRRTDWVKFHGSGCLKWTQLE